MSRILYEFSLRSVCRLSIDFDRKQSEFTCLNDNEKIPTRNISSTK